MEKIADCSKSANAVNWTLAGVAGRAGANRCPGKRGAAEKFPVWTW